MFSGDCSVALLYFAGHGNFDVDTDEGMLIPQDYKSAKDGIRISDILNWATKAVKKSKKQSDYSRLLPGRLGGRSAGATQREQHGVRRHDHPHRVQKKEEPAMEGANHGIFTGLLLQALHGGAANILGKNHTRQSLFIRRQRSRRVGTAPGVQDQCVAVHFIARSLPADPQRDSAQTARLVRRGGINVRARPQLRTYRSHVRPGARRSLLPTAKSATATA